ncbi:MAG: hypothetical protein IJG54_03395 [Bacteroidales bacterium]|nr:hypothetical protein [Bacteroidales bacterium]
MAELSEKQIKELDIDWYCLIQGKPIHIDSSGGMIPKQFRDLGELRLKQDRVAMMDPIVEVTLSIENIQSQIREGYEYLQDEMISSAIVNANKNNPDFVYLRDYELTVRLFASTFVNKARKGFRSYIRKEGVEGKDEYILIAEPTKPFRFENNQLGLKELECKMKGDDGFVIEVE